MKRGFPATLITALAMLVLASPGAASPYTTVERTIQDCDGDNLLDWGPGEGHVEPGDEGGSGDECSEDRQGKRERRPENASIINFLQLTDFQMVDEESPGRVEFFDTTQRGPFNPFSAAYRPQESLTTQVTEAMVRQARNTVSPVTANQLDLTILTGDNADSQQYNETRWFIDILDGTDGSENPDPEMETPPNTNRDRKIDPNSGIPKLDRDSEPNPGIVCDSTPGSVYDGVRDNGRAGPGDPGPAYYEPDATREGKDDGDGYSPNRVRNGIETGGRDVTVRDFPGLLEDANEPFEAIGLDMPWYSGFGNHDSLIQGNSPKAYTGPLEGTNSETANEPLQSFVKGCLKPTMAPTGLSEDSLFGENPLGTSNPSTVPPDPRRCYLAKDERVIRTDLSDPCQTGWIQEHSKTTGQPVGHGYEPHGAGPGRPEQAEANNDGYYSFRPKPGLRFIVLDTVTDECGVGEFCSEGSVDETQFKWLDQELRDAATEGQYAMVFGHHTLRTMRQPTTDGTEEPIHYGQRGDKEAPLNVSNVSRGRSLEELFCHYPNTLAYVAGHEHENVIQQYKCASETPFPGFWEVGTAAHLDWPQQSRTVELVDTGGQMEMVLTMLDHAGPAYPGGPKPTCREDAKTASSDSCGEAGDQLTRLSAIARELTYNDYQQSRGSRGDRDDRNVIVPLGRPFPCSEDAGGACETRPRFEFSPPTAD